MDDLISRQAAIAFVDCGYLRPPTELAWSDKDVVDMLKRLPSAQPEIIRCKDCKYIEEHHYEENGEPPIIKYTCVNKAGLAKGFQVHEWEFCSRAERKDDE